MTRYPRTLQWAYSYKVPPDTDVDLATVPNTFTFVGEQIPYTVPPGSWLAITDAQVASKFNQGASDSPSSGGGLSPRDSYLVINAVLAVPSSVGWYSPRIPFLIPAGITVDMHLINNAVEEQWMNMVVTALLIPAKWGQSYQQVLAPILFPSAPRFLEKE